MTIPPVNRPKVLEVLNAWIEDDENRLFSEAPTESGPVETQLLNWWGLPTGYHRGHAFKPVFLNSPEEIRSLIVGDPITLPQSRLTLWYGSCKEATKIARTKRTGSYGIVIRESYPMLDVHVHCSVLARHWRCKSPGDKIVARTKGALLIYPNRVVTDLKEIVRDLQDALPQQ